MNFLRSLNVGKRLTAGFGLLLLLMVVIIATVLHGNYKKSEQFSDVVNDKMYKIRKLNDMIDLHNEIMSTRRLMMIQRGEQLAGNEMKMKELNADYEKVWTEVQPRFIDPETIQLADRLNQAAKATDAPNAKFMQLMHQGRYNEATDYFLGDVRELAENVSAAISALIDRQEVVAAQSQQEFQHIDHSAEMQLYLLGALSLLLGGFSAWWITRSLTGPLAQAVRVADAMAEGDFDATIDTSHHDEVGNLLHTMHNMRERVRDVIGAQREMARLHDEGQISFRMDEAKFPGEYGEMVQVTNAMVNAHISVKMNLMEIMGEYAVGNLSRDIESYPGEKALMTRTMTKVKENLAAINAEIKRLSTAAAMGDFTQRGDAARFEYDFREMIDGLNTMMASTDQNIEQISGVLQAIAAGDLTHRMRGEFKGIFARMRDDANRSAEQLAKMIVGIQQASGAINMAAGEIASGNNDLSRRTEQQAANLEETAASMEELTTTVRTNAEHARKANQLTLSAADVAKQGGNVVGQVVTTMSEIEASSKKIADIITVIDGIAFQTNILALNAAVEAARAGEQGRGFAVVATEVRSLAQRSATAAREIKDLIEDSTGKVSEGAQLAGEAGRTMGEIVASVQQVTDIMTEISSASQEQAAGIEQINQTVMQMDEATQKNAALVEEAAASAGSMEQQAGALAQAVAMFKIEGGDAVVQPQVSSGGNVSVLPTRAAHKPVSRAAKPVRTATAALAISDHDDANWQEF